MRCPACLLLLGFAIGGPFTIAPQDTGVIFRSGVSLVRVEVNAVGPDKRAIAGLGADDFLLQEQGRPVPIRNFAREDKPLDLLLLIDVSASMRPHFGQIVSMVQQVPAMLGENDRLAIMVFDWTTRLRMPFLDRNKIVQDLENMLQQESFHGGTDVARTMVISASYMELHARPDASRTIVILTDDQSEFGRDDVATEIALGKAEAGLIALVAADATAGSKSKSDSARQFHLPDGGQSERGAGIDVELVIERPHTQIGGASEAARRSGGASLSFDEFSLLATTLDWMRQRYALYFCLPPDAETGQERTIDVQLAEPARRRSPDAVLRFQRSYLLRAPTEIGRVAAR